MGGDGAYPSLQSITALVPMESWELEMLTIEPFSMDGSDEHEGDFSIKS